MITLPIKQTGVVHIGIPLGFPGDGGREELGGFLQPWGGDRCDQGHGGRLAACVLCIGKVGQDDDYQGDGEQIDDDDDDDDDNLQSSTSSLLGRDGW